MSRLDVRKHPEYAATVARIPQLKQRPLVGHRELQELTIVTGALPPLKFPINSAGELIDQFGERNVLHFQDMKVDPVRMIKYMPAYYFPIASYENFVEKMAELLRANRREMDEPKYTRKMKEKFRGVKFPIMNATQLDRAIGGTPTFNISGKKMDTKATVRALPEDFFPIRNQKDLEVKAIRFLRSQPLIEKD